MTSHDDLRFQCLIIPFSASPRVLTSDGQLVPQQFTALITRPSLAFNIGVWVEADGSALCTSIGAHGTTDGERPWITDTLANLPDMGLRAWVRYAVAVAARMESGQPDVSEWPELPSDLGQDSPAREFWSGIAETWSNQATKRRKVTTPARLLQVATIYNAAVAEGRGDSTVAVAEALNLSRSQAAKLVMQCRRTTPPLLPPFSRNKPNRGATS